MAEKRFRILIAKPGLDGHDRGAKVITLVLRDAGFEVIYTGLHQTIDQIVEAALQEDVDAIGLSILSGAHIHVAEKLSARMKDAGLESVKVFVGGNIPRRDIPALKGLGVAEVFPTGSRFEEIVVSIRRKLAEKEG